jgi:hypothetical protein
LMEDYYSYRWRITILTDGGLLFSYRRRITIPKKVGLEGRLNRNVTPWGRETTKVEIEFLIF